MAKEIVTVTTGEWVERLVDVGEQDNLPRKDRLINHGWCNTDSGIEPILWEDFYCLPDLALFNAGKNGEGLKNLRDLLRKEEKQGILRPADEVRGAFALLGAVLESQKPARRNYKAEAEALRKENAELRARLASVA